MSASGHGTGATMPPVGDGSLAGRTTHALLDAVLNRRFPDDRLPPEPELAEQLAVSRTTVRAALQALERLGVLSRAPGRGTLVRTHVGRSSVVLQRLIGFRGLLLERHSEVHVDQRHRVSHEADEVAVQRLSVPAETPMIVTSKTYLADGHPAIHISDTIPLDYFASAAQEEFRNGGAAVLDSVFALSRSWPGRRIDHTVVELVPAVAPVEGTTLQMVDGTPFMRLLETHHNITGEPVALSEVHLDGRYVRLSVVRHI